MKWLVIFISILLSGFFSFAKSSSTEEVYLKDKKAAELISILEKTKALTETDGNCSMGSCHKQGSLAVQCKYPMSEKAGGSHSCQITALGKTEPVVVIDGAQARRMKTLIESAHADDPSEGACHMGSCYTVGSIDVLCKHSMNVKERIMGCSISAASTGKSKAAPTTAKPEGAR